MPRHATIACFIWMMTTSAYADVVPPRAAHCPDGYRRAADHAGPYCEPPLPSCPKGHKPRVIRTKTYCEPPPSKPCPAGSYWQSSGPGKDNGFCYPGGSCNNCSGKGQQCVEAALCIYRTTGVRQADVQRVTGVCPSGEGCPQGDECVRASWCVSAADLRASGGPPKLPPISVDKAKGVPAARPAREPDF
jgi:hypothetical protein